MGYVIIDHSPKCLPGAPVRLEGLLHETPHAFGSQLLRHTSNLRRSFCCCSSWEVSEVMGRTPVIINVDMTMT